MHALIAYFSRAANNYMNGTIQYLKRGNTEIAADIIASLTGAEQFRLEPVIAYSDDYSVCVEQARRDLKRNARLSLKAYPSGMDTYDTIYLGFPNYWGTMPMAVFTFLEKFDFSGRRIFPFCTHEGSGMGRSVQDIERCCPGSKVEKGLAIRGTSILRYTGEVQTAIQCWLNQ